MKTLIIYDNEGYIISTMQGQPSPRKPIGLPFLEVEIPEGKRIKIVGGIGIGVDVAKTPHELILEDIPPTKIDLQKQKTQELENALLEMSTLQAIKDIENEQAIMELTTMITMMGGM